MDIDLILSIALGIGLAAACGFRIFLPLFVVSLLTHFGVGDTVLSENFNWIGSTPALITFGVATLLEIFAYYIPFVDNLLDTVAIPLAATAGTLIMLSTMMELAPLVKWSIALIAGGGIAGVIKGTGATTRAVSSATTAGVANPIVSTAETGAALVVTLLAWFLPVLAVITALGFVFLVFRWIKR